MSVIGGRIREIRMKKGITQEKLGQMIGITTQAVSKWERGGSPDAEMIPLIADALGVSVNALFRDEDNMKLDTMIIKEISALDGEEAFQRAFSLCWAIEMGLTGQNSLKDKFTPDMLDTLQDEYGHGYYSKLLFDNGLVCARLSKDCRYFFLMPQPDSGFKEYVCSVEELSDTFALLSDKKILEVIFYMYHRKNTPVSLSLIAQNIGLDERKTELLMKKLCDGNLAACTEVETEHGEIKTYTYRQECSLIPLLFYAGELREQKILNFVTLFHRNQPLF